MSGIKTQIGTTKVGHTIEVTDVAGAIDVDKEVQEEGDEIENDGSRHLSESGEWFLPASCHLIDRNQGARDSYPAIDSLFPRLADF